MRSLTQFYIAWLIPVVVRGVPNVCDTFDSFMASHGDHYDCINDPDVELNVTSIIQRHGYPVQVYQAVTEDGYLLTIFRIPQIGLKRIGTAFLQHPATATAGVYVDLGPNSLAFLLADAGYDVWLGNFRGTHYSSKHTSWPTDTDSYWNFSFHEMGRYDLPAMLNTVKAHIPANEKIFYVGHSLATTAALVYASLLPRHAEETAAAKTLGIRGIFMHNDILHSFTKFVCVLTPFSMNICALVSMYLLGFGPGYQEAYPKWYPMMFYQNFGGFPVKCAAHFGQCTRGTFRQYDYGAGPNLIHYGSPNPPSYPIHDIRAPFYLIYGENDWMSVEEDVNILYNKLPNSVKLFGIRKVPAFNHVDFVYGRDVRRIVYEPTVKLFGLLQNVT